MDMLVVYGVFNIFLVYFNCILIPIYSCKEIWHISYKQRIGTTINMPSNYTHIVHNIYKEIQTR